MRLDLVLKRTAIIKRRVVAKNIVDNGHAKINGKLAKPSSEVKNNDIISLRLGQKTINVKIIFQQVGRKEVPFFEAIDYINNEN